MSILLGTNAYDAPGDAGRRQAEALRTWTGVDGVHPVNLQWPDAPFSVEGLETVPTLRRDSRAFSGGGGPRKPVATEVFDRLAELAERRGCRWFGYANADVQATPALAARVAEGGLEAYAVARTDVDPESGRDLGIELAGTDAIVLTPAWWRANRRRFRAYPLGEPAWDNVYTAIAMCHSDGAMLNREPLLRHVRHLPGAWGRSPLAPYVSLLAALDHPYFTRWCTYWDGLVRLRAADAPAEEEDALRRRVFHAPFPLRDRLLHAARSARARLRFAAGRVRR